MTIYLRKATASQECPLGQMLSSTDGLTAFTTQIEVTDIHLWKAGATTLAHSSGVSAHISNGVHYIVLDATDTDTAGPLVIYTQPTGALASRQECIVLNAAVYDAWFSTGFLPVDLVNVHGAALTETTTQLAAGISKFFDVATPTSTMNLITGVTTVTTATTATTVTNMVTANVTQISGDSTAADNAESFFDGTGYAGTNNTIPTVTTCGTVTTVTGGATSAELAKVPKSDSNVTWNATALASINAEVDTALNTAIPASNTASSINDILLDQLTFTVAKQVDVNVVDWKGATAPAMTGDAYALIGATGSGLTTLATAAELAKVPKSDAAVTWNATALASINAEVDTALNTAIPASNTATSVNDILLDVLTLAKINTEVDTALSDINLDHLLKTPVSDTSKLSDGGGNEVVESTIMSLILSKSNDADTYAYATDSLEAACDKLTAIDDYVDSEVATLVTEMAKVPKSDAAVTWNSTALASINAEVDTALNTAIPASNTANSVNDILLDVSTVAAITDAVWNEVLHTDHEVASSASVLLQAVPTAAAVSDAVWDEVLHTDHEVASSASVLLQATSTVTEASVVNAVWDEVLHTDHEVASSASVLLQAASAPTAAAVADAVWDEVLHTDHEVASSASVLLQAAGGGSTPADIADAVWDEVLTSGHAGAGSAAVILSDVLVDTGTTLDALIKRSLGSGGQENFRITSTTYSVTGKMTACVWKIYPSLADTNADTNAIATYTMAATYDGSDNLATYKVVTS